MHQIRFQLELRLTPCWRSSQRSPTLFSWILKGANSKEREGRETGQDRRKREGVKGKGMRGTKGRKGGEKKRRAPPPIEISGYATEKSGPCLAEHACSNRIWTHYLRHNTARISVIRQLTIVTWTDWSVYAWKRPCKVAEDAEQKVQIFDPAIHSRARLFSVKSEVVQNRAKFWTFAIQIFVGGCKICTQVPLYALWHVTWSSFVGVTTKL